MNLSSVTHTLQYYRNLEKAAFSKIPGMDKLLHTDPRDRSVIEGQYPDAAFALMVADNLLCGDSEQSAINQHAYTSILKGVNMTTVRFCYDKEMQAYVNRHMWDD